MAKGINVEERLLGMMAVEKRFITEKQLTECLNTIEFFEPNKTLEDIFLQKEYLTKPQIDRLRQQLQASTEVKETGDQQKRFGDMAIEQNMIDEDVLFGVLDEQDKFMQRGLRVQIGQIMFKKGYLTMAQVGRILEAQLKKVLYCKNCKVTTVIHNYDSTQIYQCEQCKWDLIEAKVKKQPEEPIDEEDEEEEGDDDVGALDILEL